MLTKLSRSSSKSAVRVPVLECLFSGGIYLLAPGTVTNLYISHSRVQRKDCPVLESVLQNSSAKINHSDSY